MTSDPTTPVMRLPESGRPWDALRGELVERKANDVDWRSVRTAVYVFNAGDDVLDVARDAYSLYQSENALGPGAFPSLRELEEDVVRIGLGLLGAPSGAAGSMTSGGTESILLAVKTCRNEARSRGIDTTGAEIVLPHSAHPAFDKAAHYLGLVARRIAVAPDFRADVDAMERAITPRTLMIVGSAPCFPYGMIDPIPELAALAKRQGVWLHVDACVGGYLIPFVRMNGEDLTPFDFSVDGVRSISADLHKYGYAAKGASTVFYRDAADHRHQLFVFDDWPAGGMVTPTVAGTRPGGAIAAAWAVLHYLGVAGYREKARLVTETRRKLMDAIDAIEPLRTYGRPKLGLFAYGSDSLPPFAIWAKLKARGWFTGVVTKPPGIHLMLSPAHARVADRYLEDLAAAVAEVASGDTTGATTAARYA